MTEAQIIRHVIRTAESFLGLRESDGSYREIVDIYNSHKPLARGYTLQYSDDWCAAFVAAVSIRSGLTAIMPTECSSEYMRQLYKSRGRWIEDDDITPRLGDIVMYDWEDDGIGDNRGYPDHAAIVTAASGGIFTVIGGNVSNSVSRRWLVPASQYIRGYCRPDYASVEVNSITLT